MAAGMVAGFNAANGYGIIKPDHGGVDLFVQIRAVEKAGYAALAEGTRIAFELRTTAQAKCP
ncbi:cold-shock protein [Bradyrhizobium sp. CCBAU 25360]|nr:cold shock domain-containing protein [Bradyrhizobium sp. CCBAU 25360]MDA9414027.1 cold-shock protein [Bradyrhizobium sp. CCBAU 25360]